MLHYAVVFLIIALIAAFLGFSGLAGMAATIAKVREQGAEPVGDTPEEFEAGAVKMPVELAAMPDLPGLPLPGEPWRDLPKA